MGLSDFQTMHNLAVTDKFVAGNYPDGAYLEVRSDGSVTQPTGVWVDIDFPILIRQTGVGIPTLETLLGNITAPRWQVNDINVCEGQELVHGWKEGSACYWHVHMITGVSDTSDRYVKFEVEYTYATLTAAMGSTTSVITSEDILIPADTAIRTHSIVPIGSFTPTDAKIGTQVYARLKRVASAGTAPSVDPFVPMLQIHTLCDTLGSRQLGLK